MITCSRCNASLPDEARFCLACGEQRHVVPVSREVRKTVTVLFADLVGSTALGERVDPERLRGILSRYFVELRETCERHGGTVEKFIGDAVMAVFGLPVVHEDDALRAVRAAAEIRERLGRLNAELTLTGDSVLRVRTGVHTGEVVAGDPAAGQSLVTGDTVNTAARLEQAAEPGEILLGEPTYHLVRDAVEAERATAIVARGKAEPISAWRLTAVVQGAAGHARLLDGRLVGRERELGLLHAVHDRVIAGRTPQLFTVLGSAGVGKSRLVAEFLASLGGSATILKGRCLPYGEGITYWPIAEAMRAAAGITDADHATDARIKLGNLARGDRDGELVTRHLATMIGLSAESAPQEELFWAVRRTLESLAQERPIVFLVEDIHWAESTLLDLLEYVIDLARDVPLLVLCPARPELAEVRPGWGGGKSNATAVLLEPLTTDAASALLAALPGGAALPIDLRTRIVDAAEGNALYLEEMLGMLRDAGRLRQVDGEWRSTDELAALSVPPSIGALLEARIDALPPDERSLAERASVIGRVFEAAALRELAASGNTSVGRGLLGLVRKELIRPERSELTAGDAFKFRHLLIRDAAYRALPKRERADLHERFAKWLEHAAGDRLVEYEEVVGYHLEQAHGYRTELGHAGDATEPLATHAALRLANAGRRALERGDLAAGSNLLRRAFDISAQPGSLVLVPWLGRALLESGRNDDAASLSERATARALEYVDRQALAHARVIALFAEFWRNRLAETEGVSEAESLLVTFESYGDDRGLTVTWNLLGEIHYRAGRIMDGAVAWRRAAEHAERSGDAWEIAMALATLVATGGYGSASASSAIAYAESILERGKQYGVVRATVAGFLASTYLVAGDQDRARQRLDEVHKLAAELSIPVWRAWYGLQLGNAFMATGDPVRGEEEIRWGGSLLPDGEGYLHALLDLSLARALLDQDRLEEASAATQRAEPAGIPSGAAPESAGVASRIAALRGDVETALDLAANAVAAADALDDLSTQAIVRMDVARTFRDLGRVDEARSRLVEARERWDRLGAVAVSARISLMLEQLG